MGLLPQFLHKLLAVELFDEAEELGAHRCIGCGLCSYVCPSKIELREVISSAKKASEAAQ